MTGQEPLDGRNDSVDFNEGALKERFETAVAGVSPDVATLLHGGVQRGEQLKRRRRVEAMGAAGLTAAAAAALVYSGVSFGWFESNSSGPANGPHGPFQQINRPATARSLAAVALEHLPAERVIKVGTMGTPGDGTSIYASVGVDSSQGKVQLDLLASSRLKKWDNHPACSPSTAKVDVVQCQLSRLDDGTRLVLSAEKFSAGPGSPKYLVSMGARRDSQIIAVLEYLVKPDTTPRDDTKPIADWRMPVSLATLHALVTDPRFGVLTSPEMIDKGNALDHWTNLSPRTSSGSGGSVTVSPPESVAPPQPTGPQATQSSAAERSAPVPSHRPSASRASSGP